MSDNLEEIIEKLKKIRDPINKNIDFDDLIQNGIKLLKIEDLKFKYNRYDTIFIAIAIARKYNYSLSAYLCYLKDEEDSKLNEYTIENCINFKDIQQKNISKIFLNHVFAKDENSNVYYDCNGKTKEPKIFSAKDFYFNPFSSENRNYSLIHNISEQDLFLLSKINKQNFELKIKKAETELELYFNN